MRFGSGRDSASLSSSVGLWTCSVSGFCPLFLRSWFGVLTFDSNCIFAWSVCSPSPNSSKDRWLKRKKERKRETKQNKKLYSNLKGTLYHETTPPHLGIYPKYMIICLHINTPWIKQYCFICSRPCSTNLVILVQATICRYYMCKVWKLSNVYFIFVCVYYYMCNSSTLLMELFWSVAISGFYTSNLYETNSILMLNL